MRRLFLRAFPVIFLLAGCAREPAPATSDSLYAWESGPRPRVGPFTFKDQSGRTVHCDELRGKIWVANFFFTGCTGKCSANNAGMAKLQADLAGYPDVMLVGFSVNPAEDTSEVLSAYARRWNADPDRWLFLTGSESVMDDVVQKQFQQALSRQRDAQPGSQIDHSFKLVLVDQWGQMRGFVEGLDPAEVDRLEGRVEELAQAKYFPAINATLNGICALLLATGYLAVRRRWLRTHITLMLAALFVSTAFLACYLYYHIALLHGHSTEFPETGWVRGVYLTILLTHIALAVVVVPLALATATLGLRNRLASHVRLARWTLPLWVYVSLTGVVVYWMLYHLYPPG
jgi:protein SCO1/2/putative membrane protein